MFNGKAYRIKRNSDFQAIYKNGKSVANRQFVVYTYKNRDLKHFRLGISVSKTATLLQEIELKER